MFNKTIVIGRLTETPEVKVTQGKGTPFCSFTVACDRRRKNADGERVTDFINCVAWRSTAEFIGKWFVKGTPIGVEGELQSRSYTNKEGEKRTVWEVIADNAFFVGSKEKNTVEVETPAQDEYAPEEYDPNADSDLPF